MLPRPLLLCVPIVFSATIARAAGPTCGFDCTDGLYTACNDDFPTGAPSTANCSASLGSCTSEAFCASFGDNFQASAFPLTVLRIYLVAASNNVMDAAMQFDLEMYQESGQPAPGPMIGSPINLAIAGSQTQATVVDFVGLGLPPPTIPNPGRFRICFRKQFDAQHNICLDDANPPSAAGRNWAHVRIALDPQDPCGSSLGGNQWYASNSAFPGIQGDFIIRPDIQAASAAGLPGGGACPEPDAGVSDTGIAPADTGTPDAGPVGGDGGEDAETMDAAPDAGLDKDAGDEADAGIVEPDAGGLAPPEITAISPDRGKSDSSTNVTITGRGFVFGLTVKIGAIAAADVAVGGSTTITALVPQGIAAGVYDVIVTNPDGQAAISADGFTVEGQPVVGTPPPEGCGCQAQHRGEGGIRSIFALGLLLLFRRAKRAV